MLLYATENSNSVVVVPYGGDTVPLVSDGSPLHAAAAGRAPGSVAANAAKTSSSMLSRRGACFILKRVTDGADKSAGSLGVAHRHRRWAIGTPRHQSESVGAAASWREARRMRARLLRKAAAGAGDGSRTVARAQRPVPKDERHGNCRKPKYVRVSSWRPLWRRGPAGIGATIPRRRVGAGDGSRTRDLQLGRLSLHQLSYSRSLSRVRQAYVRAR